jgi:hypothetical protein
MDQKNKYLKVKLLLGAVSIVIGLSAANLALFNWIEKAGFHYLLGNYARYVCAYSGFAAMIFGAMLINDFIVLRSHQKHSQPIEFIVEEANKISVDIEPKSSKQSKIISSVLIILLFLNLASMTVFAYVSYVATATVEARMVVYEPSFETVNHWTFYSAVPLVYSGSQTAEWKTHGNNSYEIYYQSVIGELGMGYAELYQDANLTEVSTLLFDAELYAWGLTLYAQITASVLVDSDVLWSIELTSTTTEYLNQVIDVSSYTGVHTLRFRLSNTALLSVGTGGQFRFDNIRVDP